MSFLKNKFIQAFVFIFLLSQVSCNSSSTSELGMTLSSKSFILLDTTTKSCYTEISAGTTSDISAVHFSMPTITFSWSSTKPALTVHWINFKLSGGILSTPYSVTLGSDQLLYSFYGPKMASTATAPACTTAPCFASVTLPNKEGYLANQCPYKVGGIPITDKVKDSYGTVVVTAYATYQDSSGNSVPVISKVFGDYFFKGTN